MEFRYEAVNREGQTLKGQLSARTELEALQLLRGQDLVPVAVKQFSGRASASKRRLKPASIQDKTLVIRELSTLLAAGVSLAEAADSTSQAHVGTSRSEDRKPGERSVAWRYCELGPER